MGKEGIERYLTAVAVERNAAASTQSQALAALLFLYKDVLGTNPGWLDDVVRAGRPHRLPVVLTQQEVEALLAALDGVPWTMAILLYGSGLRLMECLRLRVKDIDFTRNEILVREGKDNKDRVTMLATAVKAPLPRSCAPPPRARSEGGPWSRAVAGRPGPQIPERQPGVGLAVGISRRKDLHRPALRPAAAPRCGPHA